MQDEKRKSRKAGVDQRNEKELPLGLRMSLKGNKAWVIHEQNASAFFLALQHHSRICPSQM
ncbi:hypothetical protein PDIG_88890 [Penicillium digitatum PHI26]|uniref:Uncharacterized protein n=2 Tax=Penicillium digitatum TaxID=36651 RepID=K9F635_PEND2|nr:hypothetical protein PDIP_03180 [Penicillium digitatum Pd1]EKV04514.1 hypothetical protein PDIG_88890 [Penicillium digitatum PHI26]EKV21771.1 hypothetical protein PDIP_03180 [Penicillium digitatum Pd1]